MTSDSPPHPTILVVDDEPMIRTLICSFLRSRNFHVVEAGNGKEALQRIRTSGIRPQLLISDIVMPGMGGISLLKELRQDNEGLAALLVSGFCDDPEGLDRLLDHRTRFLEKPFNFKMLEVELDRLLSRSPAMRTAKAQA